MLTALVAIAPRATETLAGLAASVKFCTGFTVKVIVLVCAGCVGLVPVTVLLPDPAWLCSKREGQRAAVTGRRGGIECRSHSSRQSLAVKLTLAVKFARTMLWCWWL